MAEPTVMKATLLGCASVTVGGTGIRFVKNRPTTVSGPALEYVRSTPKGMFALTSVSEPPEPREASKPSPPKNTVLKGNEAPKPSKAKEEKPSVLAESEDTEEKEDKPESEPSSKRVSDPEDKTGGKFSTRRRASRGKKKPRFE